MRSEINRSPSRGFTLIELLIVIAIILILIAIALPNFLEARIRAEVTKALLYSVGPSLAYSWTGAYGNCYTTHYSATNGTKSHGGLWAASN